MTQGRGYVKQVSSFIPASVPEVDFDGKPFIVFNNYIVFDCSQPSPFDIVPFSWRSDLTQSDFDNFLSAYSLKALYSLVRGGLC